MTECVYENLHGEVMHTKVSLEGKKIRKVQEVLSLDSYDAPHGTPRYHCTLGNILGIEGNMSLCARKKDVNAHVVLPGMHNFDELI